MNLFLIELENIPILDQLQLEEALLRTSDENFCIVNKNAPKAIVMGVSGKAEELITQKGFSSGIPIIKRFSGGGTVAVDEDTLFVSYIFNKSTHPFQSFPEPIYRWSATIYEQLFPSPFLLRENDYAFEGKKFGGNAQYIKKDRWLHHSTFLWDYKKEHMNLLQLPKRQPSYRANRSHDEFLCTLNGHFESKSVLFEKLKSILQERYSLQSMSYEEAQKFLSLPHRRATTVLN